MLVLTVCVQKLMYPLVVAPLGVLHRSGLDQRPAAIVHFILLLLGVVLGFFVAPAAVFSAMEVSWSFLDGIYFSFISLCTIGLGDFVPGMQPGQKYRPVYQICVMGECSFYCLHSLFNAPLLLSIFFCLLVLPLSKPQVKKRAIMNQQECSILFPFRLI